MLFSNRNLSGGYSGLPGMEHGVKYEVNELTKKIFWLIFIYLINVSKSSDPSISAWIGG